VNVVWCVTSCVCVWFNISEGSAMYDIVCGLYRWTCVPASLRFDILYVVLCWQVQLCADRPSPNTPAHDLSTLTAQGRQSRLLHDLLVGQGPNSVDLNTGTAAPHIGSRSAVMCLSVTCVTLSRHTDYWWPHQMLCNQASCLLRDRFNVIFWFSYITQAMCGLRQSGILFCSSVIALILHEEPGTISNHYT